MQIKIHGTENLAADLRGVSAYLALPSGPNQPNHIRIISRKVKSGYDGAYHVARIARNFNVREKNLCLD